MSVDRLSREARRLLLCRKFSTASATHIALTKPSTVQLCIYLCATYLYAHWLTVEVRSYVHLPRIMRVSLVACVRHSCNQMHPLLLILFNTPNWITHNYYLLNITWNESLRPLVNKHVLNRLSLFFTPPQQVTRTEYPFIYCRQN